MFIKLFLPLALVISSSAFADEAKLKMDFHNEELTKVIEAYSKVSGQKFILDPGVRGKVSILLPEPVAIDEAFNHLSSALAINGYAISKQGDTMVVQSARNTQRNLIEVTEELPKLKPERMVTWVVTLKNVSVATLNRDMRILSSKDGEMVPFASTNQLYFTDWTSNIHRIAQILKEADRPIDPAVAKIVASEKSETKKENKKVATPAAAKE